MEIQLVNTAQAQLLEAQANAANQHTKNAIGTDKKLLRQTAEDFEAVFLSQMMQPMFNTIPTDGLMGGGHAESVYRGMMVDEMGKSLARAGGVGIADTVYREMLKMQEA